jgi:hypothetical protein
LSEELRGSDPSAADLVHMTIDELLRLGDSPLAYSLRRRRHEMDHSDTTVACHDSTVR